ncbi:MAG: hypothetical protein ACI4VI_08350 [Acutalibacteraceae bacterium]
MAGSRIINSVYFYAWFYMFIISLICLVVMIITHFKHHYKKSTYVKAVICIFVGALMFYGPEVFKYQKANVSDETLNSSYEINAEKLWEFVCDNDETEGELEKCCDIDVDGTYVTIDSYPVKGFESIKADPLAELSFMERTFAKYKVFEDMVVIIYPVVRDPDIDDIPYNKYAFHEISIYSSDGNFFRISYNNKKNDPDLMKSVFEKLKNVSD